MLQSDLQVEAAGSKRTWFQPGVESGGKSQLQGILFHLTKLQFSHRSCGDKVTFLKGLQQRTKGDRKPTASQSR